MTEEIEVKLGFDSVRGDEKTAGVEYLNCYLGIEHITAKDIDFVEEGDYDDENDDWGDDDAEEEGQQG